MNDQAIPQYRVLLTVDIEDYSSRTDAEQRTLQSALTQVMDDAADMAELNRQEWTRQLGGDGITAILPVGVDVTRLMDAFIRKLDAGLGSYNRLREESTWTRMRLRLAVHAGPMYVDGATGWPGQHAVQPSRLRDSKSVRTALATCSAADLAVIVSADIFRDYVVQGPGDPRPTEFRPVRVVEKKQSYTAYLHLPGHDVKALRALAPFDVSEESGSVADAEPGPAPGPSAARTVTAPGAETSAGRDVIGHVSNQASGNGNIQTFGGDGHFFAERTQE